MEIIKEYVEHKKHEIADEITTNNYKIKTVVVQVGDNKASNAYIKGKLKDCAEVGIECELKKFDESITEEELIAEIEKLNNDNSVDGFIVQLPLPKHISEARITEAIDYHKDIDGFTKLSLVNPATPQGIITYLEDNNFKFDGKNAVILGRSTIVGKPLHDMLLSRNMNVINLHTHTSDSDKRFYIAHADLILSATGHRNTLDCTYNLNPNAIIIDFGMEHNDNGKICGDIESNLPVAFQTHNPGSTGLTTRLALLLNIIKLYKINNKIS